MAYAFVPKTPPALRESIQAWISDPDGNAIELMEEYTHASLQLGQVA